MRVFLTHVTGYEAGSVFTVKPLWGDPVRLHEVVAGPADAPATEPWFHVAVTQFEDDGTATNARQIEDAVATIHSVRSGSPNGAIVVVFIHGWHHSAAWKRSPSTPVTDADGDEHFHSFRLILESLALRELERPGWRRVVGVYLGWNGDPSGPIGETISRLPGLTHSTFWNRYPVAARIGTGATFRTTLRRVISATKDPVSSGDGGALSPDSPLVMIGHSMGALMLESGVLGLLEDERQPLIRPASAFKTGAVQLKDKNGPVTFPDLVLALNSAADSRIAKSIQEALGWYGLEKMAADGDITFSPPVMMSVTSAGDTDTRDMWRLAQGLFAPWRQTDGHDSSLITHDFTETAKESICQRQLDVRDFGQNWHCLRRPFPLSAATPAIPIDLPVRERTGVGDELVSHARYTLVPRAGTDVPRLIWIFQVPSEVIKDHNDVFNSKARSLVLALIQISGAVASLADNWGHSFEPE